MRLAQNVTPPPKKQPNEAQILSSSPSRKQSHPSKAASSQVSSSHTHASKKSQSQAKSPKTMSSTTSQRERTKQPITLKAQLKSQIQQLHRQKKQSLLLKEKQKLEAERARRKLEKEKELHRIREDARKAKELERLRKEEERTKREKERKDKQEKCQMRIREESCRKSIASMLTSVEKRLSLEAKTGISYGVSETVESLVKEVEKRVGRNYHFQQRLYQRQQFDFLRPWMPVWNPYGHGNNPFSAFYSTKPPASSTLKPLILHTNPIGDPYSPFHASHRIFEKKVIMVKCSMNDSFGVVLRLESKSALVPREEGVMNENVYAEYSGHTNVAKENGGKNEVENFTDNTIASKSSMVEVIEESCIDKESTSASDTTALSSSPNVGCVNNACRNASSTKQMTNNTLQDLISTSRSSTPGTNAASVSSSSAISSVPHTTNIASTSFVCNQKSVAYASSLSNKPKRKRRRRVNFGVVTVVEVKNAKFAVKFITDDNQVIMTATTEMPTLQPGDIILSVNGRNLGGMTFTESCRMIGSSSKSYVTENTASVFCCILEIARAIPTEPLKMKSNVPPGSFKGDNVDHKQDVTKEQCATLSITRQYPSSLQKQAANAIPIGNNSDVPATAAPHSVLNHTSGVPNIGVAEEPPLVPFVVSGMKVISGEFSVNEWGALITGFIKTSRQLSTGMALMPVNIRDVLLTMKSSDSLGKKIRRRGIDALEAKLLYEGKAVEAEMSIRAEKYWESKWKMEVSEDDGNENNKIFEPFLTDAKRNILRSMARPSKGCKCGSISHDLVNNPQCVLFRDVKAFASPEISTADERKRETFLLLSKKKKPRTALEAAYIERFMKLRAENDAQEEEAKFVLEMEKKQAAEMKMAVFAPGTLCVMVLSAVAVINESLSGVEEAESMDEENEGETTANDEVDEDHDADIPLTALIGSKKLKRSHSTTDTFPSKRLKIGKISSKKELPSSYFLARILEYVSQTFGHLFHEPSHAEYSWQQRHRSVLTKPLPKDVMFRGNPRNPGALSFENIRFLLDKERMIRLQSAWEKSNAEINPAGIESWNDEWIITYLSSNKITGLSHEIDVMENLDLITVNPSGSIDLKPGWEKRVPQIILIDMKEWGTEVDPHNLFCIHPSVKSALEMAWERVDDYGWRYANETDAIEENNEVVFDDEEYYLRKQIFEENFNNFVNEDSGMGNFGI